MKARASGVIADWSVPGKQTGHGIASSTTPTGGNDTVSEKPSQNHQNKPRIKCRGFSFSERGKTSKKEFGYKSVIKASKLDIKKYNKKGPKGRRACLKLGGAEGRTRTDTRLPSLVFENCMGSFTIPKCAILHVIEPACLCLIFALFIICRISLYLY